MAPEIERSVPPRTQIANHLRQEIRSGVRAEGSTLPSVRQLADDWGVSPGTAQAALAQLRADGLVVGIPGKGTVVRARSTQGAGDRARYARSTGRIYPDDQYAKIVSAELVPAPDNVASALGGEAGSPVVRRHRVTYRRRDGEHDVPVSTSVSWFAGELAETAPLLVSDERIVQGTFGYIEQVTGRAATDVVEELSLSSALTDEAALFDIAVGSPVIRGENWMLDPEGGVIEFGQSVHAPERKVTYRFRIGD